MKGTTRFFFFFFSLEDGLCPLMKFHFCERFVNKILWMASLHKVFLKNVVMFFSNVLIEEFALRRPKASPFTKPFFAHGG